MNEAQLKQKLRRLIKPHAHIQSVASPGIGGTPDLWVSGGFKDLWLEVKYDERTKGAIKPNLSPLQTQWLTQRRLEGRNVAVLVGTSPAEGILYLDGTWEGKLNARQPLTDIINQIIRGVTCVS